MEEAPVNENEQEEIQRLFFEAFDDEDTLRVKELLVKLEDVDCCDQHGTTALQRACINGDLEIARILLDMGANVNFIPYPDEGNSPLFYAADSGEVDLCRMLLDAGADPTFSNWSSITPAHRAALLGKHECADFIDDYMLRKFLKKFTLFPNEEPSIPTEKLDAVHKFVTEVNLYPVRIALNLKSFGLLRHLKSLQKVLLELSYYYLVHERNTKDVQAIKCHYFSSLLVEISKFEKRQVAERESLGSSANKLDFVQLFVKRALKECKEPNENYVDSMIRESVHAFPRSNLPHISLIRTRLAITNAPGALDVLRVVLYGFRGLLSQNSIFCSTCKKENPDQMCSKCKVVQYCDSECQRLHWFMHKKECARLATSENKSKKKSNAFEVSNLLEMMTKIKSET